jgi:hypothetical protein
MRLARLHPGKYLRFPARLRQLLPAFFAKLHYLTCVHSEIREMIVGFTESDRLFSLAKTESLFTFSSLAQSVGYFFVNFSPMADGENPDQSGFAIQFVNNAKLPDFDSPQAG